MDTCWPLQSVVVAVDVVQPRMARCQNARNLAHWESSEISNLPYRALVHDYFRKAEREAVSCAFARNDFGICLKQSLDHLVAGYRYRQSLHDCEEPSGGSLHDHVQVFLRAARVEEDIRWFPVRILEGARDLHLVCPLETWKLCALQGPLVPDADH